MSVMLNIILFGIVVILFHGQAKMSREMKMLKSFSMALIDFAEEQTGKNTREVQAMFTNFLEKRKREDK